MLQGILSLFSDQCCCLACICHTPLREPDGRKRKWLMKFLRRDDSKKSCHGKPDENDCVPFLFSIYCHQHRKHPWRDKTRQVSLCELRPIYSTRRWKHMKVLFMNYCIFIILEQLILLDQFMSCVLATHYRDAAKSKSELYRFWHHILSPAELHTICKQLCKVPCGSGGRGWEMKSLVIPGTNCFQPILTQTETKQSFWDRRTEMIRSQP